MVGEEVFFTEGQRFNQWWVLVILLSLDVLFIGLAAMIYADGGGIGATIMLASAVGIPLLILGIRLDTQVRRDGVYVRFIPFQMGWRVMRFDEISTYEVRRYSPIRDFGGYGYKVRGGVTVYSVSGDQGILITLKNGRVVMIGTQRPHEMHSAMRLLPL